MIKKIIIYILIKIYSWSHKIEFLIYKKKSFLITHNQTMGFGDSLTYIFFNYRKIKKSEIFILNYIKFTKNISDFFFGKDKSLIFKIPIPYRIYYQYMEKFGKQFFKMSNFYYFKYDIEEFCKNKNIRFSFNRLVRLKLKKYKFDYSILPSNYITINLKYFNDDKENLSESVRRQVINLNKFVDVFKFLSEKKISVIITNSNNEKIYKKIKKIIKSENLKNIYFFTELIENPNFVDQCFLAINSKGYLGSDSGPQVLYLLLHKKAIAIDCILDNAVHSVLYNIYTQKFNYRFLLKKINIDNKIYNLDLDIIKKILLEKNNYSIIGCTSKEIIDEIDDFFHI